MIRDILSTMARYSEFSIGYKVELQFTLYCELTAFTAQTITNGITLGITL